MKLTSEAAELVKKNRRCINRLALEMDVHSASVERWIKDNEPDGDLTKAKAVEIIAQEIEMDKNSILE